MWRGRLLGIALGVAVLWASQAGAAAAGHGEGPCRLGFELDPLTFSSGTMKEYMPETRLSLALNENNAWLSGQMCVDHVTMPTVALDGKLYLVETNA
ncbi:hypothetical protein BTVI_41921 [Pitangus sulphuratus]|nr:hypothetical protein BTVI_41921 [Pitangus sulphuratus]